MLEKPKVGSTAELNIDKLSYNGGRGVGRHFNFVVFVADTAPGDLVKVKFTKVKKNFAEAQLIEIIKPSKYRTEPPCPVFRKCGGCTWQHINYQEQLEQKKQILKFSLRNFWDKDIPIQASPKNWNYRNRIQLQHKNSAFGYHERGTNNIVPIKECLIANEEISNKINKLQSQDYPNSERIEIALNQNQEITIHSEKGKNPHSLFSQVNTEVNQELIKMVLKTCEKHKASHIFDLYSGDGNFSFPLAQQAQTPITAVELSSSSIELAQKRLKTSEKFAHLKFFQSDVSSYLKGLPSLSPKSLFILDPPRAGCEPSSIEEILRLQPQFIIYISCNLPILARDLNSLTTKYKITQMQALDMFPQTEHMETVCFLESNSAN